MGEDRPGDGGTVLRGERVVLRPATAADTGALVDVLTDPAVARWWGRWDVARVAAEVADDDVDWWVVESDGAVAGLVQSSEEDDPDYRHAGIDIAVHPRHHGRGLGRDVVRTLARHLIDARGHHRLTIDPAADNAVAIRCYRAVGFRPVGVLRRYERAPDGTWRDGLLMDLLADELE